MQRLAGRVGEERVVLQVAPPGAIFRPEPQGRRNQADTAFPVIPLKKGRVQPPTPIERGTDEWRDVYKRRTSVEREFGNLKHNFGLAFLRVRGIERVRLHADLVILARLAQALSRTRA